jgi:hypothetical protein
MAESLLFPAAPLLLLSFLSPSYPSHARQEHWCQCPICKTACAVELVLPIYVNHHTAHCCGWRGEMRMGGRTVAAAGAKMIPILLGDAAAMGQRGQRRWAATHALPPPPTSTAATTAAAVAAGRRAHCCHCWRWQRRGDNTTVMTVTTATMTATMGCTVTAASTVTATTAMARAPRRNRPRRLCQHSYLCLHALSFCVSCFFYFSH